jgi:ribonuclease P protein component
MSRGARKEGLSRRHRFVGRSSFSAVLRSSRKLRAPSILLHVAAGHPGQSRLGLASSKRIARRSVDRNRMKRLAREAFRRHAAKTAGLDLVVAPRQAWRRGDEDAWLAELRELLDRAAAGR